MDRKVSNKVWVLVNNIEPGVSKNITYSDAWEKLSRWGGFEGGLETKADGTTLMDVWVGDQKVKILTIQDGWNEKERDWNWHEVFSQTLEYIFGEGLIKKPRARRKDAKKEKVLKPTVNRTKIAQISKETEKMSNSIDEPVISQNNEVFETKKKTKKKTK